MKNQSLLFITATTIVLIGIIVYFCYLQTMSKNITEINSPAITTFPTKTATSSETKQVSATSETYRNKELGFEFSYPEDTLPKTNEETSDPENPNLLLRFDFGGGNIFQGEVTVEKTDITDIEKYPVQQEVKDMGIKEQHYATLSGEKTRITTFMDVENDSDGLESILYHTSENDVYVQVIHNKKVFSLLLLDTKMNDFPDTVLSTFKFIN